MQFVIYYDIYSELLFTSAGIPSHISVKFIEVFKNFAKYIIEGLVEHMKHEIKMTAVIVWRFGKKDSMETRHSKLYFKQYCTERRI